MEQFVMSLDHEHPMLFLVSDSIGVQIMDPDAFRNWVWMEVEDSENPFKDSHVRVFQYGQKLFGRTVTFTVTSADGDIKDVLIGTRGTEPLLFEGELYVIHVGRPAPRTCYYIDPDEFDEGRGFVPCVALEGHHGRWGVQRGRGVGASPWYWGMTREIADKICAQANRDKELTATDVLVIMQSAGLDEFLV